jgi:hypothetical protein
MRNDDSACVARTFSQLPLVVELSFKDRLLHNM